MRAVCDRHTPQRQPSWPTRTSAGEFLLDGGVFTEDLIETWIGYKMDHEVSQIRLRPHPHEFHLVLRHLSK